MDTDAPTHRRTETPEDWFFFGTRARAEASCVDVREDIACDELEMEVFDGEVCAQAGMEQVRR